MSNRPGNLIDPNGLIAQNDICEYLEDLGEEAIDNNRFDLAAQIASLYNMIGCNSPPPPPPSVRAAPDYCPIPHPYGGNPNLNLTLTPQQKTTIGVGGILIIIFTPWPGNPIFAGL